MAVALKLRFIGHTFYHTVMSYMTSRFAPYIPMVFSRSRKRGSEQRKSFGAMAIEPSSSLSGILKFSLVDEGNHKIVDGSHYLSSISDGHASGILFEGNISPVM